MTRSIIAVVAAAAVLSAGVAFAQKGQGPKGPKTTQSAPKTHVTKTSGGTAMKPAATQAPKTTRGAAATSGAKTKAPKTTTASKTTKTKTKPATTAKTTTKPSKATTTASTSKPSKTTTTTSKTKPERTKSTATTTATTTTTTLTPVQQKLQRNTNLADKLKSRLPAGTDLMKASEGFRNLGQFVAAVNVSHNHKMSFTELKALMVEDGMSLGQAIQSVRSDSDATTIALRATTEADLMIADAEKETARKQRPKTRTAKMGSGS